MIDISIEQFCEAVGVDNGAYELFKHAKEIGVQPTCKMGIEKSELGEKIIYSFDDHSGFIRYFKHMPEYGEIWTLLEYKDKPCGIWSTWRVIDQEI